MFTLQTYDGEFQHTLVLNERNLANVKVVHSPNGNTLLVTPTEVASVPSTVLWSLKPANASTKPALEALIDATDNGDLAMLVTLLREGLNAPGGKVFSQPGAAKALLKRLQKAVQTHSST